MVLSMSTTAGSGLYRCDILPAPRLAPLTVQPNHTSTPFPFVQPVSSPQSSGQRSTVPKMDLPPQSESPHPHPTRKLCVRHQRTADQGTNLKLQQALDALPEEERQVVNSIWSSFSSSSHPRRELILQGILTMCCFSQLSLLTEQLGHLTRIDPFTVLPREVSLRILAYLDAMSLCRAAQVSMRWRSLADDDVLWREICQQHIGQKCLKCGWCLPILERRRQAPPPSLKRELESVEPSLDRPAKRQRSDYYPHPPDQPTILHSSHGNAALSPSPSSTPNPTGLLTSSDQAQLKITTRPWKDVYSERLAIERNWRRGRCLVRTLHGHTDGVMCLQFNETLQHPSFPILITGSYDRTVRVWNLESGLEVRCLRGHTRAVRTLQFDEAKLVTGSMDRTIRVWNWRKGECIRTLEGHTEGVVCLNFDASVLASGSVDTTVKIWNFCTGEAFTLRGHGDWVNSVYLWDSHGSASSPPDPCRSSLRIETGKMLFSASDDGDIRLWDLAARTCVRQFIGHVGQVQSLRLLEVDDEPHEDGSPRAGPVHAAEASSVDDAQSCEGSDDGDISTVVMYDAWRSNESTDDAANRITGVSTTGAARESTKKPVLISGSLDNTIKVWDIETGKATRTLFGHIEGVWTVACDKLRLVSGSHDRTIKVWNREEGKCTATLVGHCAAVTCIALGEDKIVSGSDDGEVRIWNFSDHT